MAESVENVDPTIANLFKSLDRPDSNAVTKGSLIVFNYSFWMNDPYPLVVVTDMRPGKRLRGVNLHYLTFPYIKNLIQQSCGNIGFSYTNIRGDKYITNAFRTYKWNGIRSIKKLDCNFLLNVMASVRSFDPNQMETIRASIREQMSREVQPKATGTGEMPL